jgi:hypothetical protein
MVGGGGAASPEYGLPEILDWCEETGTFPERMYGGAVIYLDRRMDPLCASCATSLKGAIMEAQGARIARRGEQIRCACGRLIS